MLTSKVLFSKVNFFPSVAVHWYFHVFFPFYGLNCHWHLASAPGKGQLVLALLECRALTLCTWTKITKFCPKTMITLFNLASSFRGKHSIYRTRAIISRCLYFFYPIFTLAAAYIADNLCTKNGISSFFKLKIRGL